MVSEEDVIDIIKEIEKKIPTIEDSVRSSSKGGFNIDQLFIPLAIMDDLLLSIRSVLRNLPQYKPGFKNLHSRIIDTKLLWLKYLRILTNMGPETTEYLEEMMSELKGGK
jgi:hypothetical protein